MNQNNKNLDVQRLRAAYDSNYVARLAFDYFAQRQNNSSQTTVERLMSALGPEGSTISRSQIVELFKGLQDAGCGTFVVGRKGKASRFEWGVSLIDVGRFAGGEPILVEQMSQADKDALPTEEPAAVELLVHRYRLRPDLELAIELPPDLTPGEAGRIADFIRTLPF